MSSSKHEELIQKIRELDDGSLAKAIMEKLGPKEGVYRQEPLVTGGVKEPDQGPFAGPTCLLNDRQIRALCTDDNDMIRPFNPHQIRKVGEKFEGDKVVSYGLSSAGYDTILANQFKITRIPRNPDGTPKPLDPKNITEEDYHEFSIDMNQPNPRLVINPGELILSRSEEYFKIPRDIVVLCIGKSTYARTGLIVNVTPLEPGWHGNVTLEIHNTSMRPVYIYPHEGICQFLFFRIEEPDVAYSDRGGKYQGQTGVTTSRL